MKNIRRAIATNVYILYLIGQPLFLAAQTPGVRGGSAERYNPVCSNRSQFWIAVPKNYRKEFARVEKDGQGS